MTVDQLSSVFGALADPTRRAILARLAQGDLPVRELAAPFPMSQPAISRHLKVLERAGLISRTRRATARLSHIEPEPLRDATEWLARYQALLDERFERLDGLLASLQRRQPPAARPTPARQAKSAKDKGRTAR
jgi:DNA-binding transcriptional ArsR family regulator